MRQLLFRSLNVLLIAAVLTSYQTHALNRAAVVSAHQQEETAAAALAEQYQREAQSVQKSAEQLRGAYTDGTWEGTADGFGGPITISVTVSNGFVADIQVLSAEQEDPAYFAMAQQVIPALIEAQGEGVDAISGATFSSTGLIQATANALEEAK